MNLHATYPALSDLRARASRRIPRFVWEYLDSATGAECTKSRNRAKLDEVLMMPSILHGEVTPDLSTTLFGQALPLPFGIAPVGMSGMIWPGAESHLARAAATAGIPYTLSTVATRTPADLKDDLGDHAWFQMYPPRDPDIRTDMLKRARDAGFGVLVLTVDVPVPSRRERQVRSGLTTPPRLTPRLMAQVARCPSWALGIARHGMPRMRLIDEYAGKTSGLPSNKHAGYLLRTAPDWDYLRWLRDAWDGPMIVKGVLDPGDATRVEAEGVDAIWVSNHAGRQFDAAPATIESLPAIRAATGLPIVIDGGFETGLDILRAIALGADFVMLGRPWHYALGALGADGPDHLADILTQDLIANMGQLGLSSLAGARDRLVIGAAGQ
ncbi:L-lactate dehydrogenase (cytochrome) [Roseovarius halotolerans]|uniref:L-lactate dehydrogenase [cytochrome] n=1 Tax=Roseovarius halotolerans TaxID=505353 RepID=A0A1X6ZFP0_9RHOB|nr:alpha-hydroxy acid oxidase [Roseovarius halotolerans]RKT30812.1 L-lactate dehydrogenase (cytochrome) [Roseovarius halotolerans]SLN49787.1 L-lactate dehydrogenase [cytochrome] [Roseovarius halotolerans]